MQSSDIPTKFQMPFGDNAAGGNIRAIPVTTADPNAASESLGWPPSTLTPEGAGGVPPDGRDVNGLDNRLSAWVLWYSIGGPVIYDATEQTAIGGYPLGAIVGSAVTAGNYWRSTAENNITNPDAAGAGWTAWPGSSAVPWASPPAIGSTTPNTGAFTTLTASGNFTSGGIVNAATDLRINGIGFIQGLGIAGYQRLPSGLIIQWGQYTTATGSAEAIAFPYTFPNATFQVVGNLLNSHSASGLAIVEIKPATTASALLSVALWNGSTFVAGVGCDISYIAIGN